MEQHIRREMIEAARKRHGDIYPVSKGKALEEGFNVIGGELCFWYNDSSGSTRIIRRDNTN